MAKQCKVAVNLAQDFTNEEKAQARANIGIDITWKEFTPDTTVSAASVTSIVHSFGNDGCIGYYFDSGASLRLTWWHNELEAYPSFYMWYDTGSTSISSAQFQTPVSIGAQFYNGNGQKNTLRWKYDTFRCVDFYYEPNTNKLYWRER